MRRFFLVLLIVSLLALPLLFLTDRDGVPLGPQVALIEISGSLADTTGDSVWNDANTGARDVIAHLRTVQENPRFAAVILRIDSPGGSPAAAQEIYAAVRRTREAGKPVVASLGNAATSAAYYVAAAADRIVANPGTLTGSIGAIAQVISFHDLLERYGIHAEVIASGPYKDAGSPYRSLEPWEREWFEQLVNELLDQFVADVAKGRGMDEDAVRSVADGRVFTGRQALALGLVDQLGGLEDAVAVAAELAGLQARPDVVPLRRPRSFYDRLLSSAATAVVGVLARRLTPGLLDADADTRALPWLPLEVLDQGPWRYRVW